MSGFTQEHVRHLRDIASGEYGYKYHQTQNIADRIEALLQGFTHEDVEGLRLMANQYDDNADNYELTGMAAMWFSSLADRIEALLPPKNTT